MVAPNRVAIQKSNENKGRRAGNSALKSTLF
jgi:hypothetical protein